MSGSPILILGGGAAGLAAARRLSAAGVDSVILESRSRLGGRIVTDRFSTGELCDGGPEFLHGSSPLFDEILQEAGIRSDTMPDRHLVREGNELVETRFGGEWETIFGRLNDYDGPDLSFAEFLRQFCEDVPADARRMATEYVEGFNAADQELISIRWLRSSEQSVGVDEQGIRRLQGGYDQVVAALEKSASRSQIELETDITHVSSEPGTGVRVTATRSGGPRTYEGRCAIATFPIGVLQAGVLRFVPDSVRRSDAIRGFRMGEIIKAVLLFREPFWRDTLAELGGFLHVPGRTFMTWWPLGESRVLTGWSGGPRAGAISRMSTEEIRQVALDDLAEGFGLPAAEIASHLVEDWVYNWCQDPWALGAYSYATVGHAEAHAPLQAPGPGGLFWAGEATDATFPATVAGAIHSGDRAARQALEWLSSQGAPRT
ncbi:flavin monoamine oxidase family protein [Planctomyces sp. SH-PL14]|uniref:flavin monoamine oxidase family protein n=1 Tax=Planctomyces sp. SH-PL14 TaxID=1632864 RepID=UPI00078EB402|nr:NAD(P)/FAD-dependent oxidoreductase [Planctomyces sp. SH-PL14]AMV17476.1 Pseudooxynicotine oxidase [Planctomyces sp. SH-PL14]